MEAETTIRIAGVVRESIVDGPGIRFVIFCQGCPHGCPGCHNQETHDFNGGTEYSLEKVLDAIDSNPLLKGVTFSGGEPICQAEAFAKLAKEIVKRNLDIVLFSGYTLEELEEMGTENPWIPELLKYVELLIDGKYQYENRDLTLKYRGSSNQRAIDMKKTLELGEITLSDN